MNSGDWVESLSALVEDFGGNWSLLYYHESKKRVESVEDGAPVSEFFEYKERLVAFRPPVVREESDAIRKTK